MLELWNAAQPVVVSVLTPVVMVLIGWTAWQVQKKTGVDILKAITDIEANHRDALHSAIQTGIGYALSRIGQSLPTTAVHTKWPLVDAALAYIVKAVPDAVAHFGLTDAGLSKLVEGKLEQMLGMPNAPDGLVAPAAPAAGASAVAVAVATPAQ